MTTIEMPGRTDDPAQPDQATAPDPVTTAAPASADTEVPTAGGVPISELLAQLEASPIGRIVIGVDPNEVVFGDNIRTEASITPEFIDSIREHELVQLPTAFINDDSKVQILVGQRRILAAREAGYNPCPIVLSRKPQGSAAEAAAEVIGVQWEENEARENMTTGHKLGAVERCLNLGVTPNKIAKKLTGITKRDVLAVKALQESQQARTVAAAGALDFTQAQTVMEFEDNPEVVDRLINAAARGDAEFIRAVESERTARRVEAARIEAVKQYQKRGFTILDREPYWDEEKKKPPLSKLRTVTGEPVAEADMVPEHWGVVLKHNGLRLVVASTGEEIDDEHIEPDPSAELKEGMRYAADVIAEDAFTPHFFCLNKKAAGLVYHEFPSRPFVSPSEKSAQNNRSRQLNELARIDTVARRNFVTEWLRKSPTKDAIIWRAQLDWADPGIFDDNMAPEIAAELLGVSAEKLRNGNGFARVSIERANAIMIGKGMGAVEARMQPNEKTPRYWRAVENEHVFGYTVGTGVFVPYLKLLRKLGHTLGPVDRYVIGEITDTEALAEHPQAAAAA
ncbi:hypothetical protein ACW9HH_36050 [Nocardia gipuzkoensis]